MKHLILIAALLTATSAWADDKASRNDYCASAGKMAELVMDARQKERPMSVMMQLEVDPKVSKLYESMVMKAYNQQAFLTAENRQRAVREFRNTAELECYKSVK